MVGIYGLLLLSLLLILVVPTSYCAQLVAAYTQDDLSVLDSDIGIHTQLIADTIFDIFTRAFELCRNRLRPDLSK